MKRTYGLKNLVMAWYIAGAVIAAIGTGNVFSVDGYYSSHFNGGAAWAGFFAWLIGNLPIVAIVSMLNTQVENLIKAHKNLADAIDEVGDSVVGNE